ncbi:MAG: SsrA-binding protein SmpB, partial [Firmicutes bacterium]|nr:SsrA-binding protein SmpB [Bacillota bacterium]
VVATNRPASFYYDLLETLEAGLVLTGTEVKSLREGKASLRESYATVRKGEVWLLNCHIPEYRPGGVFNHDPLRPRKLLLHRSEIHRLAGRIQQKGLTLVPLRIYFRKGLAKVELALARGKKAWDRRQAERERQARREAEEAFYHHRRRG